VVRAVSVGRIGSSSGPISCVDRPSSVGLGVFVFWIALFVMWDLASWSIL